MAVYGVLGDIHGNFEALRAVLAHLDARGIDRLLCVGDLVGYNADPDACVALLRERGAISIAGNHDLIGTGLLGFDRCSNKALHSLKRTRRALRPQTAAYLRALPSHHLLEGRILLTHGGVRDVQQYMTKPHHIRENLRYLCEDFPGVRVCFFGHTHEQKVFAVEGDDVSEPFGAPISAGEAIALASDRVYFRQRRDGTSIRERFLRRGRYRATRHGRRLPHRALARSPLRRAT